MLDGVRSLQREAVEGVLAVGGRERELATRDDRGTSHGVKRVSSPRRVSLQHTMDPAPMDVDEADIASKDTQEPVPDEVAHEVDVEVPDNAPPATATESKKGPNVLVREKGRSVLPMTRVQKIMKADKVRSLLLVQHTLLIICSRSCQLSRRRQSSSSHWQQSVSRLFPARLH